MKQRLVPYKSEGRKYTEATIATIVFGAVGFPMRLFHEEWIALLAALIALYATFWFAAWWARRSGQEMITPAEATRRQLLESAKTPIGVQSLEFGANLATANGICTFLVIDIQQAYLPLIVVVASFFVGTILGLYSAIDARRYVRSVQSSGPELKEVAISQTESTMRHYLGYAVGLSASMIVADVFEDRGVAAAAMFASFFLAKFAVDIAHSGSQYPRFEAVSFRYGDALLAIPFGIVWWGLPFGILAVSIAKTLYPDLSMDRHLVLFSFVLGITGLLPAMMAAMAKLMNLLPGKSD